MSKQTVNQVIQKAIGDAAFRRQLQRDPSNALAGFDLSTDERAAITSGDPTRLTALGVDQRMSKAFGLGGMTELSKTVLADDTTAGGAAFIDEGSAAGTSGLVGQDASDSGTAALISDDGSGLNAAVTGTDGASSSVIVGDPQTASAPHAFETPNGDMLDAGFVGGTAASAAALESTAGSAGGTAFLDAGAPTGGYDTVSPEDSTDASAAQGADGVTEGTQVDDLNQGY